MPRLKTATPKLHRHATGQAFIKVNGQQIYLGKYREPLAHEKYNRLVGTWMANGRQLPTAQPADAAGPTTISMMMAEYVRHVDAVHPTAHSQRIKDALAVLRRLYGSLPAGDFTPANLEAVRAVWIEQELTRSTINAKVGLIVAMFKWCVARGHIPAATWQALTAVEGLRKGRTKAKESRKVRPAPAHLIEAIKDHVAPQVWALVQLQLLTGARSGELVTMKASELDMSGDVWTYRPASHKTEHHGHDRVILIGPKAQAVIGQYLPPARPIDAPLFSPREALKHQKAKDAHCHRRPNQKANQKATARTIGDCYTNHSFRRAIERGLAKAFPFPAELRPVKGDNVTVRKQKREGRQQWTKDHHFHPHQLRHATATLIRKTAGVEAAGVVLGHSTLDATAIYAEGDMAAAIEVIRKIG